jgi:hypothetical protein
MISEFSFADIAAMAGYDNEPSRGSVSFKLGNMQYCQKGFCKCSQNKSLQRFFYPGRGLDHCSFCGENIYPHPFYTFSHVPATIIADRWDCRLEDLGVGTEKWAMLRGPERSLLLISS